MQVTDRDGKPSRGSSRINSASPKTARIRKSPPSTITTSRNIEKAAAGDTAPVTISIGGVAEPEQLRQTLRDRRLIVLFFDLTSLQTDDLTRSTNAAKKFLHEQMTAADLVGVVAFGNQLQVISDFTNDRDLLDQRRGRAASRQGIAARRAGRGLRVRESRPASPKTPTRPSPPMTPSSMFSTPTASSSRSNRLADLLRDIPGKKSVIQFTSGITQTGEDNRSQLRATTDAANRANVSFYTVDSRGLMAEIPGGDPSVGAASGNSMFSGASVYHQQDARQDSRETLATLASDTGGRSVFRSGRSRSGVPFGAGRYAGYYLLGYYSTNAARDGRWRTLQRARHRRARRAHSLPRGLLRARRISASSPPKIASANWKTPCARRLPSSSCPIAVETAYFRLDKNQIFVPISAKLAASALQWAQKSNRRQVNFDFAAEIRGAQSNRVVGALRDTITVNWTPERFQQLQQNALRLSGRNHPPAGRLQAEIPGARK